MSASALVLDGHLASALAAVRDLRARGIRVLVGAPRRTALALHSNAAALTFVYPDPKKDLQTYLEVVQRVANEEYERTGSQVVPYFFSDDTFLPFVRAASSARSVFAWAFADTEVVETAFDKQKTLALAKRLGLPIPLEADVSAIGTSYPLIIKPRHSCVWPEQGEAVRGTASRVYSETEAHTRFDQVKALMGEAPLIQQCISGREVGLFTVCQAGNAQGWFAHQRLLGIHPDGGASSIRESMAPPSELVEWSGRLLSELGWNGPAMVEWKYDEDAKTYRLMEINGRWWGSLPLTLASQYPVVWLWYGISTQGSEASLETVTDRRQVRAIHSLAVVKCLLTCLRLGRFRDAGRAVALCCPSKNYNLKDDVFSWRDPMPAIWEVIDVVARG